MQPFGHGAAGERMGAWGMGTSSRHRLLMLAPVLAALASGCGIITGLDKNGMDDMVEQRRQWEATGLRSYEYVVRHDCACYLGYREVRVVVRNGVRDSIVVLDTGESVPDNGVASLNGVPGLFEALRQAYMRRAVDIDVVYDETWHYPRAAYIDEAEYYRHDNRRWYVVAFTPMR